MAAPATLPALLDSLTNSLSSALEATSKFSGIEPPKDGLSLLDVKNELLLSYLQNLVFLIVVKLRQARKGGNGSLSPEASQPDATEDDVVKKLVELRLYLEKGVRPLEDKLRYQIDKVLAADDALHKAASRKGTGASRARGDVGSGSSESDPDSDASEQGNEGEDESARVPDLQFRPNLSAFVRPPGASAAASGKYQKSKGASSSATTATTATTTTTTTGAYRPPRIAPTAMPLTAGERRDRASASASGAPGRRRPLKSATLDEFIADELSAAPVAMPSIGTTITAGGRRTKTTAEKAAEDERRAYEETNFVRLPAPSKKDKARKAKLEGGRGRMSFGGEEWRDLGAGADRVTRLTRGLTATGGRSGGSGAGRVKTLLEKSRKRGIDTADGPRGSGNSEGVRMGEQFQKRLRTVERADGKKQRKKR